MRRGREARSSYAAQVESWKMKPGIEPGQPLGAHRRRSRDRRPAKRGLDNGCH